MFSKSLSFSQSRTGQITLIFALAVALALAAQVKIPLFFTPVPLTLQTFIVYLAIRLLKKKAFFPVFLYVAAGIFGLPVFTASSLGLVYLAGPTGGYIVGFLVAALLLPFLFSERQTFLNNLVCFLAAALIIYSLGITWLVFLYNLSLPTALVAGLYPFILGEAIKIVSAAFLTRK